MVCGLAGHPGLNVQQPAGADTTWEPALVRIQPQRMEGTSAWVCTQRRHSATRRPAQVLRALETALLYCKLSFLNFEFWVSDSLLPKTWHSDIQNHLRWKWNAFLELILTVKFFINMCTQVYLKELQTKFLPFQKTVFYAFEKNSHSICVNQCTTWISRCLPPKKKLYRKMSFLW